MTNIMEILKNIDKKQLDDAIQKAKEFSKTQEGQQMVEKLKRGEAIDGLPITSDEQNQLILEITKNPSISRKIAEFLSKKR